MKKKDLLQRIKSEALNEMPDVFDKINLDSIEINEPYEEVRNPFNFRRAFTYTFASLFIFVSGFMIYNFGYIPSINNSEPLASETELLAFQTVSSASLLSSYEVAELNADYDIYTPIELSQSSININDEVDLIGNYLNLAETMVGNENSYIYNEIDSDRAEYAYAFEYKSVDLIDNLIVYKGYYNIIENGEHIQISNGILVHEDKTYEMTCTIYQDGENRSYEYKVQINNNNYVNVTNSSEGETQRFSYTVYHNGSVDSSSDITLSSTRNNLRAVMEIQGKNNQNLTLEFNRDTTDKTSQQLQVKYIYRKNNQMTSGEFNVELVEDESTGNYTFQYRLGETVINTYRPVKGNQKATDDDFINNKGQGNGNKTTDIITTEDTNGNNTGGNPGNNTGNNPGNHSNTNPGNKKNRIM